jgi:tetratricopeptide (TPR) repeat protein
MLELLTEHPKEPSFLASYIHMLFSQHRPASAIRPWIEKLETLQPDAPATVGMKARLAVANRQDERAVKMLRDLVPDPVPRRQVNSLRSIASLMEELELTEAAEQTLRRFAEEAPGGSVVLGAFLGRQGRLDEALDQCEAALGDAPLDAVIAAAVAALNHNRNEATPEQIARVETLFDRVSEKNADAKSVQLQRATLSGIKGKYDEVVRLYRDFLKRDDLRDQEKAVVWNNLAFFLAVGDGDPAEALSMINEAIDVIGPSSELLDTRAMAYLANDQAAEAVADMRQAVADNPSAVKYFHLALAHERNGNSRAATQAIQTGRDNHQLTINDVPELERDDYRELVAGLGMADYADMPGKRSD